MFGFIVRRLVTAFVVLTLTSMFVFGLFFLGPSNPAEPLCNLNGKCTPAKLALLTEQMGLNDSFNTRVTVTVMSGQGRVTAYASVIDNKTADPTFIPAQ